MKLGEHLSQEQGLSDLLNYAHIVDDGVIINKDGAFLMTYKFRGPDINSASGSELDALTNNFNRMACFLEDGWMIHVDDCRVPSLVYPPKGHFPDSVSALIDDERRQLYESEDAHFENIQFLTFVWKFPMAVVKASRHMFLEGVEKETGEENLSKLLKSFLEMVSRCVSILSSQLILEPLNSADLLSFLNTCISGELLPIAVPPDGCYIDTVLARRDVVGGYVPRIGGKSIYVLSLKGYINHETMPGILEAMGSYPLVYRWSNRFIPLSPSTAEREIKRYQKNWNNKISGVKNIIKETLSGKPTPDKKLDKDALMMSDETQVALTMNSNGATRFGYWTSEVVLMHESTAILQSSAKGIAAYLEQLGFTVELESVNAFDAWLGSIPGHGSCNVRRMFVNAINFAHAAPLHSVWAGDSHSSKSSLLPANSPPVFFAATMGKTPFRHNLDVGDVGHQVVLGPTSAGKTTFLQFQVAQFLRYENAQVYIFDKDFSHMGLTAALGGNHYNIGDSNELAFCPLADLSTKTQQTRAAQFIEDLVEYQNVVLTSDIREAIYTAIIALSSKLNEGNRNLTVFSSEVQNSVVRSALQYYTLKGPFSLLDATENSIKNSHLNTFDMTWALNQKPEIYLPVLRYLFDQIEMKLDADHAKYPTLIVIEEAWLFIGHPTFASKIRDWLKTLRKKNARVILATQSLSDIYDVETGSLTGVTASIMEACFTKIYLPNNDMDDVIAKLYSKIGLSERQIQIIHEQAVPKREYYVVTRNGNRLIDLGFTGYNPVTLAFIGLGDQKSQALIECKKEFGDLWIPKWLEMNNFNEWAQYWNEHYKDGVLHAK